MWYKEKKRREKNIALIVRVKDNFKELIVFKLRYNSTTVGVAITRAESRLDLRR